MASTVRKDRDQLQDYKKSQQVGTHSLLIAAQARAQHQSTCWCYDLPAYAGLL